MTEIRSHIGISLRNLQHRGSFNPDTQVEEQPMLLLPLKSAKPPLSENVTAQPHETIVLAICTCNNVIFYENSKVVYVAVSSRI